jgi:hypothetical protein
VKTASDNNNKNLLASVRALLSAGAVATAQDM